MPMVVVGSRNSDFLPVTGWLVTACTQPGQVYKHRWQVGDVILWDNALTMHRRDEYESVQRRFLKRTTISLPEEQHIIPRGQKVDRQVALKIAS